MEILLEKVGLKSGDIELIQVGVGGSQRAAAFQSRLVAGVVTSPDRFEQLKIPYFVLADAMEMGIKVVSSAWSTVEVSSSEVLRQQPASTFGD
jgi:hypothetical protein